MNGQEALLSQRYGERHPRARLAGLLGTGLLAVVFLGWLGWAMLYHATPEAESQLIGYEVVDDHHVTTQVQVSLGDGVDPQDVDCRVRALAADHTAIGERVFTPAGGTQQVTVRTARRATAPELLGCTTADQARPR